MKTVGIIAEYNPFHNGHAYQIAKARELTKADYVIVIQSGDFTQRGYPGIVDKFTRAHMALAGGADMVLELPLVYATSSAELFGFGAVSILQGTNMIDTLVFGSETDNLNTLKKFSHFLTSETEEYRRVLKHGISTGLTFPAARKKALEHSFSDVTREELAELDKPNNILALEYLKALYKLNSSIVPCNIQRMGAGYHEETLTSHNSSATALRKMILSSPDAIHDFSDHMPVCVSKILTDALKQVPPVSLDDFSSFLAYQLINHQHHLTQFLDVDESLANRIRNTMHQFTSITSFLELLKHKAYTHTRISRALCHILLEITPQDIPVDYQASNYARVLGVKKESKALLSELTQKSSIPVITNLTKDKKKLSSFWVAMLEKDIRASQLYHLTADNTLAYNEYTKPLLVV